MTVGRRVAGVGAGVALVAAGWVLGATADTPWQDVTGTVLRLGGLVLALASALWPRSGGTPRDDGELVTVRVTDVGPAPVQTLHALRQHAPQGWFVPPSELVGADVPVVAGGRAALGARLAALGARVEDVPPPGPSTTTG